MKFSRDPISGIIEVYSDDGEYLGSVVTMGNAMMEEPEDTKESESTGENT